jgi:outer membrane protein OmpA-like peptidoglycan-associated protein
MRRIIIAWAAAALLAGCTTYDQARHDDEVWRVSHHGDEIDYEGMDEVLFAYDSADLSPHAYDAVANIADDVRQHPHWLIEVNGYTDTVGSQDYNLPLSRARAQTVADALVHNGIEPARIAVHGFGKTHLAVPTGDNVREGRNRRVVIRLIPPDRR